MDQMGENLNRYYVNPSPISQPTIYAAKSVLDYYASKGKLSLYLDLHAHASKRGCFIYGNVMDTLVDQVQNQLFCRLIALNTPHFDYEGCLFSREHMKRIDPGDLEKGLTAEGSGRVATYLAHKLIHSYTLECNYNMSRVANEVPPCETDPMGANVTPASPFNSNPTEKYTPATYHSVGRACIVALLDIRGCNPCSRVSNSKLRTLEKFRQIVTSEVRNRKEYKNQSSKPSIFGGYNRYPLPLPPLPLSLPPSLYLSSISFYALSNTPSSIYVPYHVYKPLLNYNMMFNLHSGNLY